MSLRSPASILTRDTLSGLQGIKERLAILQNQITQGKRIVRTADDPAGAALVVDLKASIGVNAQYIKQINDAIGFLGVTEQVIDSLNGDLTRLVEIGQQGLNGTNGAINRQQLAAEVDGIRTNFISYSNQKTQGKFIFAGTQTQTLPFGPAPGPVPPAGAIVYAGDSNSIDVNVGPNTTVALNVPGDALFFGPGGQGSSTDLFQQVTDLRDALNTNNVAGIQTAADNLRIALARVNSSSTGLGGRQATILNLKDNLEGFNLTLQGVQNSVEDLDYPKAVTDFQAAGIAQQATLSTLAKANNQNLFNFLG